MNNFKNYLFFFSAPENKYKYSMQQKYNRFENMFKEHMSSLKYVILFVHSE